MTSMFLSPAIAGERSEPVTECDDRIGSKTNVPYERSRSAGLP
jgi:hypothetical protein